MSALFRFLTIVSNRGVRRCRAGSRSVSVAGERQRHARVDVGEGGKCQDASGVATRSALRTVLCDRAVRQRFEGSRFLRPDSSGGQVYNFWQDAAHVRGIWRTTTIADYAHPAPAWKTVLDLDALAASEGKNWIWQGADCDSPSERRCLIALSDGGEDASTVREFDLTCAGVRRRRFQLSAREARRRRGSTTTRCSLHGRGQAPTSPRPDIRTS